MTDRSVLLASDLASRSDGLPAEGGNPRTVELLLATAAADMLTVDGGKA